MSWVQEGQERTLNLLITLSPNFPSSQSLTLATVRAVAPYRCSQKRRLVTAVRTSGRRRSAGSSTSAGRPVAFGLLILAGVPSGAPPATLKELTATVEE